MRDAAVNPESSDFLAPAGGVSPGIHANQGIHPVTPGVVSDTKATQQTAEVTDALRWQPTIHALAVTPATATVSEGGTEQLTATATLNDESTTLVVTAEASWSSSDTDVATVDAAGLVTVLVDSGTADITATFKGESDTVTITAEAA